MTIWADVPKWTEGGTFGEGFFGYSLFGGDSYWTTVSQDGDTWAPVNQQSSSWSDVAKDT